MKKTIYIVWAFLMGMFITSCKKDAGLQTDVASLTIINAAANVPQAAINFSPTNFLYVQNVTFIPYQSSLEFGLETGANPINIISSADTTGIIFHGSVNLALGGIYSLYIAGTPTKIDTLFLKDNIPVFGADSVAGVRFINLSPDSSPLSISQQGASGNVSSGLAYKKITAFYKYAATSNITNNGGYTFNITDASGNVLTTFNWNPAVSNKSSTLVISGMVSAGGISVFQVNNY